MTNENHRSELVAAATTGPETDIAMTRHLAASPEEVYDALLDADHIDSWWGPEGCTTETHSMDPRVGGLWHHTMTVPDGTEFPNYVRYLVLERPRLIEYEHGDTSDGPALFRTTITLAPEGGGTRLAFQMRFPSKQARDGALEYMAVEGAHQTLDGLEGHLARVLAPSIEATRVIHAPRERVFEAFTDPAVLGTWWGPDGFTTTTQRFDLRPGGVWDLVMHGPDGTDHPNHIVFREVEAPERIRYDHGASAVHPGGFQNTFVLEERGEATLVAMRTVFPTVEERDAAADAFVEGGEQTLARLASHVEGGRA